MVAVVRTGAIAALLVGLALGLGVFTTEAILDAVLIELWPLR